jgi:uncharacterized C2H2 Zn-finger protein
MTSASLNAGIATLKSSRALPKALLGLFGKKGEAEEKKKVWKCQYCSMTFDEKERLRRHTRKAHSEKGGDDLPNRNPFGF